MWCVSLKITQAEAGGRMKACANVNTIQQVSEKSRMALYLRKRSAIDAQNGAEMYSTKGRTPMRVPAWMGFMPSCLKYTAISGKSEPKAE